jgi:rubrerythrin
MPQEYNMQEALRLAIQAKKNLMDFYLQAARITENPEARRTFEFLAKEVRENAGKFFAHYRGTDLGSFEAFMGQPPRKESAMMEALKKALDKNVHERKARELAMAEEEDQANNFRLAATHIVDPAVRKVFEEVAADAMNHHALIESEYARLMAMVHETDMDSYVRE